MRGSRESVRSGNPSSETFVEEGLIDVGFTDPDVGQIAAVLVAPGGLD